MKKYIWWIIYYSLYTLFYLFLTLTSILYLLDIWNPLRIGAVDFPIMRIISIVFAIATFLLACYYIYQLYKRILILKKIHKLDKILILKRE